uniref:Uncharacterized protein n=1 Tax=Sphaerodactylus townsendi TaxID=933632 RepID=A0ACB8EM09_9SAUR
MATISAAESWAQPVDPSRKGEMGFLPPPAGKRVGLGEEKEGQGKLPNMYWPLIAFILGGLLLPHGVDGHSLSVAYPTGSTSRTSLSPTVPGRPLFGSILPTSSESHLPQKSVSCQDLMPDALEDFASRPKLSQIFIQAALALALQAGGCTQHADTLVLRLYKELGKTDANALLSVMARSLGTANSSGGSISGAALQFNLDQLGYMQARHCKGLMEIQGSVLHGQVHSVYREFQAAAAACHQLGDACAGVTSNSTGFYQVIGQDGSYFLPYYGAHSWLHQCQKVARNRRSAPKNCISERERKVHAVVDWIPVVDNYYNAATSIYYATQNCTDVAKERALDAAVGLGYDLLAGMTGGASSVVGMAISSGLKPFVKQGIYAAINYFNPKK